uniref:Carbohydrate sulfotransferase n=1 Tax=Panagrellus redivivus TaxID=6233 RepID=A0A7E4VI19_PANRE
MASRTSSVLQLIFYLSVVCGLLLFFDFINTKDIIGVSTYNKAVNISSRLLSLYEKQEKERQRSLTQLTNFSFIYSYNEDQLPEQSAFGTNFSNPEWPRSICTDADVNRCGEKFKNVDTRYRVSEKYNTISCIIQKNMSTMLQAIMCFLFDEDKFLASGRSLNMEAHEGRFCLNKNEFSTLKYMTKKFNVTMDILKTWKYLLIIRDPVDKFLSGFVDKCVRKTRTETYCNNCQSNLTCFVLTEYDRIMNSSYGRVSHTFEDKHFFPQNWHCHFESELERYQLIRYSNNPLHKESFIDNLVTALKDSNVPESSLAYIKEQLVGGRTYHVTADSEARAFYEKRLMSSPFLLEYVFRMYYWDYRLFGFELPIINQE